MIGPENWSKLAIVANTPDKMKMGPKYFLNEANIFLGLEFYQL